MESHQALYYPFIHFKNDDWVKLAALYWDRLGRIVPYGYTTEDSETVKELGLFIETFRPGWVRPEFGETFVSFISEYGGKLKEKYALSGLEDWPPLKEEERPPKPGGRSGDDPRLGYIFYEKMSDDVHRIMTDSGLAKTDEQDDRWIGMHPRLAWVYMSALAEQLSGERGLRPLTDETRDHMASSGFSIERLAHALLENVDLVDDKPAATEMEAVLVSVAVKSVVPKGVADLSVEKILEFREKYPDERARFQVEASKMLNDREWLKLIPDKDVLEQRLRDEFDKTWTANLEELEEQLADIGIDSVRSCFNYKTVLPAGVLGTVLVNQISLNPLLAGTTMVTCGAFRTLLDSRKAGRKALRASPVSYLYRMEQDLKPADLWSWVKGRARSFALGV